LVQHGAILLAASNYTPALPGIQELTGRRLAVAETADAVRKEFGRQTGWDLKAAAWTPEENCRIEELVRTKYGREGWKDRR
jgi:hypothetical protein